MNFLHYGHKPVSEKVEIAESTKEILKEEKIVLDTEDTVADIMKKVEKSKKLHAKVSEGGKKVKIKRVLKD